MKIKRNWFERMQEGSGKKISRRFFYTFVTPTLVTKYTHEKAFKIRRQKFQRGFVMLYIQKYFNEWKNRGFFQIANKQIAYKIQKKGIKPYSLYSDGYLMNLEPVYQFCKEFKKVEFTEEEKKFLNDILLSPAIRKEILLQFQEESVVYSTLMFYVKNSLLRYFFLLADIRENKKKYAKLERQAEENANPENPFRKKMKRESKKLALQIAEKYGSPLTPEQIQKDREWDIIKVLVHSNSKIYPLTPINQFFEEYISARDKNSGMVQALDKKILSALNISPAF